MLKQKKGITLIALVITIVVLLVLAGVVVNLSLGENGIIEKAKTSTDKYEQASVNEKMLIAKYENEIEEYSRGAITLTEEELKEKFDKYIENKSIDTDGITFNTTYIDSSESSISITRSGNLINACFVLKVKATIPTGDIVLIYGLPKFENGFIGSVYKTGGGDSTINPKTVHNTSSNQLGLWWTGSIPTAADAKLWGNIVYITGD